LGVHPNKSSKLTVETFKFNMRNGSSGRAFIGGIQAVCNGHADANLTMRVSEVNKLP
jgi:hypothetical protein